MKRIYFSLIVIFLFAQCSSTRMIPEQKDYQSNLNKINYLGRSNDSQIFLTDSSLFNCYYLNLTKDSLTFTNAENDSTYHISNDQLSKIVIQDNTASIMGGIMIGIAASAVAIFISSRSECSSCHPNLGPVIAGTIAAIVGYLYGYNYTGEKEFLFNNKLHQ